MPRLALAMLFAVATAILARAETPKAESLKEFVEKNKTRHAVGLYLQGKKVGFMVVDLRLAMYDGKEVALETTEMLLSLSVDGEKTVTSHKEKAFFSLEGDGDLVFAEERSLQDKKETVHTAVPSPAGLTITTKLDDNTTKRDVAKPKANVAQSRRMLNWLTSKPKKGDTFEYWSTSWDEVDIDTLESFTFLGKKTIAWGGVETEVFEVKINMKGAIFDAEVLANGNPIRGKVGGLLELRAESEEVARKLDGGNIDMIAASSIKVDQDLGYSPQVVALTLEVVGLKDFTLPESRRQKLRKEDGKVFIDLKTDFRQEEAVALSDEDKKKYTTATPTVQSDHEKIKKLAGDIIGNETDVLKKTQKLKSWVYGKLKKTMASNSSTALGVLDLMAGDCTEHSLLFVSLARAAGVPARELTGVAHIDRLFGWHAWAEVHDGHQWVSVDPTWNELYVDATHVVFSKDTQDYTWLNVLGNVKFKVVSVEKKK